MDLTDLDNLNDLTGADSDSVTEASARRWRTALNLSPSELWLRALDANSGYVDDGYTTVQAAGLAHSEVFDIPGTPWGEAPYWVRDEIVEHWGNFLVNLGSHLQPAIHRGIRKNLDKIDTRRIKIHDMTALQVVGLTHVKGAVLVNLLRQEFSHGGGWSFEGRWEVWSWDAQVSPAALTQVVPHMIDVNFEGCSYDQAKAREIYDKYVRKADDKPAEPTEPAAPTEPTEPTEPDEPTEPTEPSWAVCETPAGTLELQRDDERAADMTDAEAAVLALQAVNNGEVDMAEATRVMIAVAGDLSLHLGMGRREVQMLQARLRYLSRSRLADALPDND